MGFARKYSIRSSKDIKKVIDKGRIYADGPLKMHLLRADEPGPVMTGFAVPKYGRTIVARNLLKRRLQELTRLYPIACSGYLTVIRISKDGYLDSFPELRRRFTALVERINADLANPNHDRKHLLS